MVNNIRLIMQERRDAIHLKPGMLHDFNDKFYKEVFPRLQRQNGFVDAIIIIGADCCTVEVITEWSTEEDAAAYSSDPDRMKMLEVLLDRAA